MTVLLDGNMLIALIVEDHVHHARAETWIASHQSNFATTPITQGTLLRLLIRNGVHAGAAVRLMAATTASSRHEFWADDLQYDEQTLRRVIGHRQVTDSYLAALARHRSGRVATLDTGFAAGHPDIVDLVPLR